MGIGMGWVPPTRMCSPNALPSCAVHCALPSRSCQAAISLLQRPTATDPPAERVDVDADEVSSSGDAPEAAAEATGADSIDNLRRWNTEKLLATCNGY